MPFDRPLIGFLAQLVEPGEIHDVVDRPPPVRASQTIRPREEVEILQHVHIRIGAEVIGHEAQAAADSVGIVDDRETVDEGIARLWTIERRQNSHAGGFAGAVGADVAEHLPPPHFKRNIVDRFGAAKVTMQMAEFDHRVHFSRVACDARWNITMCP